MSDSDEGIDPALAAAMGFSSFGGAPTAKKRKFNDQSFVEGQKDGKPPAKHGTGANDTPLLERKARGPISENTIDEATQPSAASDHPDDNEPGDGAAKGKKQRVKGKDLQTGGLAAFLSHGQNLPARPGDGAVTQSPVPTHDPSSEDLPSRDRPQAVQKVDWKVCSLQDLRRGVRNEHGDMAYFLPSYIEDPWKGQDN
ncbi:hypothetical protein CAC42_8107 [Sphaceloma murrayae]|uniref:Uncharacterized protein n=1 Tax=Sphaceloma murrayae TaxID=2082308 RepID=A0A2K1QR58_9PEZI|nr:hypothetical protein CAC42_8107 [Sphaceloma murrayae]